MNVKSILTMVMLLCAGVSPSVWAVDSTFLSMGSQISATSHSYVLASGVSSNVQGSNQFLGSTDKQCQAGTSPQVVVSVADAGSSQNCPLSSFHTQNPYINNTVSGYAVYIGYINVDIYTSLCHDRGASLNWTINCVRNA